MCDFHVAVYRPPAPNMSKSNEVFQIVQCTQNHSINT